MRAIQVSINKRMDKEYVAYIQWNIKKNEIMPFAAT